MIKKKITYYGKPATIGCDEKCNKAWGTTQRPRSYFLNEDTNPDDFEYLADQELGEAPIDPESYTGGQAKPKTEEEKLNKWCCEECERSGITKMDDSDGDLGLVNFSKRVVPYSNMEPTPLPERMEIINRLNNI